MKDHYYKIAVNLLLVLVVIYYLYNNYHFSSKGNYALKAKVLRIYDGDTFLVYIYNYSITKKIRLKGIDFPDLHPYYRIEKWNKRGIDNKTLRKCYDEGVKLLENLLLNKTVWLRQDKIFETDKYNRLLVYVYLNNTEINELLIKRGYAIPYYSDTYKDTTSDNNGCLHIMP